MLSDIRTFLPHAGRIKRYRRRKYLFERMAKRFAHQPEQLEKILDIFDQIRDTHRGEPRRKNEESRLIHEREMAGYADIWGVKDPNVYIAIGGHDGPEDYRHKGWTLSSIRHSYGPAARHDIRALTNPRHLKYLSTEESYSVLQEQWRKGGQRVLFTKGIDRLHYFRNPWPGWEESMVVKYNQTYVALIPEMVRAGLDVCALTRAANSAMDRYQRRTNI